MSAMTSTPSHKGAGGRTSGPLVVIPEPITELPWSYDVERSMLEPRGIRLLEPKSADEAREAMRDADVIFTSSKITAEDIATFNNAAAILCYSVGMDYVDAKAAKAKGIEVWNCPTANNEEVSDHAVLLILAVQRRLLPLAMAAAEGNWDIYNWPLLGEIHRLKSRTIGIIGLGRIGHLVAQKLGGFRCTLIAYDPYIAGTRDANVSLVSLDELAKRADIVVSCAALTDTSRGIISRAFLAKTKPGVLIVNVSRGGIVDEAALKDALESGHVAFAGLDVRSPEPPDPNNDLLTKQRNVILTQHIAASSTESLAGLHVEAAEQIIKILEGAGRLPKA
jgi:D-3-phosphoglycerate dehydrogenase